MSTVKDFLRTGENTGNSATSTETGCAYSRYVTLTPTTKNVAISIPDNLQILRLDAVVLSAISGSTTPVTVRCGTSASTALYAGFEVSAEGVYASGLTKYAASLGNVVTFDATCAGTAAGFVGGLIRARVILGEV